MAAFRTLDDLDPGQRVLVRLDINSPIENGVVQDNRRFERHAETVQALLDDNHAVVCMAHQGRPGDDDFVSLEQHADLLADYLDRDVDFVADVYGDAALDAVEDVSRGEALLLENVRMTDDELPEREPESHAESPFVRALAPNFHVYVNDAYSASHRAHASLVGFPLVLPAYAGRVMQQEYEANTAIASRTFDGEVTMVVGGTKATDVIDVMNALEGKVNTFCLGGIAGELFLRAAGYDVGYDVDDSDLFTEQWERNREVIETLLDERGERILLPVDLAYEDGDSERAEVRVADVDRKTTPFLDVGDGTVEEFGAVVSDSAAVFVKGALGVFEDERFADGTVGLLESIAATDCFSVVGGGDTSRAIDLYDLDEADFSHVSIAGGAYIRALTGGELVAVECLFRSVGGS